jgi:2-keto-4-pentenoate hydratase
MVLTDGAILDAGGLIAPRVEAEIAFVLDADVPAGATRDEVAAAIGSVAATASA